jgi:serine/threonine protein kinase/Tol biopolymer transport system component
MCSFVTSAPLSAGSRFGDLVIVGPLGAGGMGIVYRATDTKLDRSVALKVLPEAFVNDRDRLARFDREAHTLAALNHPNIAQIYGLAESDGRRALVMELVEGEDLSLRISRGPLPVPEAVAIARQIASALEAAHDVGFVHRDLKSSNVRVREDGAVKVLDFGLAKAMERPSTADGNQATITSPAMTAQGIVLGTAAYMAPEQARGRSVDKRADIWAFGVVLYELLTGARPFDGESVADTLGAVVSREADWSKLPADISPKLRGLLRRCLEKDPRNRLRDIGEARIVLEAPADPPEPLPLPGAASRKRSVVAWAAIGLAFLLVGLGGWWIGQQGTAVPPSFDMFTHLTSSTGEETAPAISPDGASIAFASDVNGSWDIFVQRVGGQNPVVVAGDPTRHEGAPAFSPDGLKLAFHESDRDGGLFVAGATGESARRLTDFGFDPAWSHDGREIVFATGEARDPYVRAGISTLWIIAADGGSPRQIAEGDAVQPTWSPSGRRIAFWGQVGGQRDLFTIATDGSGRAAVVTDAALDWSPTWSTDGHVYFASDRGGSMNIWRVAIDETSGHALGRPEAVTKGVHTSADRPSLSRDGSRLAFRAQTKTVNPAAIPLDPAGGAAGPLTMLLSANDVLVPTSISPDGNLLLLHSQMGTQDDIFVLRQDGTGLRRLTDDAHRDRWPRWSRDGREVFFFSNRSGRYEIWRIDSDGSGLRRLSNHPQEELLYPVPSPRGDQLMASVGNTPGAWRTELAKPWSADTAHEIEGLGNADEWLIPVDWSPDGRRLVGPMRSGSGTINAFGVFEFTGAKAGRVTLRGPIGDGFGMAWLDDRRVILVQGSKRLIVFDVTTGAQRLVHYDPSRALSEIPPVVNHARRLVYVGVVNVQSDVWMVTR